MGADIGALAMLVDTQRSPGLPRSPLPPAHMEQPDSPQKNPASPNTRSSPAASAWRFTVVDPGTTMATMPLATRRPRTTAAAAMRSGRRALVQEPMKTRSTGNPAIGAPGDSPMYSRARRIEGRRSGAAASGSGTRPVTAITWLGSVPQVTCGARSAQSMAMSWSKPASGSLSSRRQAASARSHNAPWGAKGRPLIQEKVVSSGAPKPERAPISMARLHSVRRLSTAMARTVAPAYSTA